MYVNRILILLLVAAFLFAPNLQTWVAADGDHWYRPFVLWLLVIAVAYLANHSRHIDDV